MPNLVRGPAVVSRRSCRQSKIVKVGLAPADDWQRRGQITAPCRLPMIRRVVEESLIILDRFRHEVIPAEMCRLRNHPRAIEAQLDVRSFVVIEEAPRPQNDFLPAQTQARAVFAAHVRANLQEALMK